MLVISESRKKTRSLRTHVRLRRDATAASEVRYTSIYKQQVHRPEKPRVSNFNPVKVAAPFESIKALFDELLGEGKAGVTNSL